MESSDVILDRLWRPTKSTKIADKPITVRALSGPEQEARAFYATNQARKLAKELEDHESAAYQSRLEFLEDKSIEELTLFLRSFHETEYKRQAEKDNPVEFAPIPDEATDEEKRDTLDTREKIVADRDAKVEAITQEKCNEYVKKYLDGKSRDEVYKIAKDEIAGPYLNERANMAFVHYSLYASVQNQDGTRYFTSPEDAGSVDRNVIFNIFDEVKVVNEIDPLALKSNGSSSTASPTTSG